MISLKGKYALLTGASRGIGRLTAECMAAQGVNLILHSRKQEHTQELAAQLRQKGIDVRTVAAELSDLNAVERMLAEIDAMGVEVAVVLNNAGLQVTYRDQIYDTPAEDYETSFRINTIAPMMICYHFIPKMKKAGFGRVVNTTSGIRLEPQQGPYSASKAALDKVSIDLGSTLKGTGVTINLVDPGWCRTDLGGPKAPNDPSSALPGVIAPAFFDNDISGLIVSAQDYAGLTLDKAVEKAQGLKQPY